MKKVVKIIGICVIFSLTYMISFHFPTRKLVSVYTYYGFRMLLILTGLLTFGLYFLKKYKKIAFDKKDCIIIILMCFLGNAFFFGMVPVTLERSISVFMLEDLEKTENRTKKEIEENFVSQYVYEKGAFDKRLEEQLEIHTIEEKDGKYKLSNKGRFMLECFKGLNKLYHIESKILLDEDKNE